MPAPKSGRPIQRVRRIKPASTKRLKLPQGKHAESLRALGVSGEQLAKESRHNISRASSGGTRAFDKAPGNRKANQERAAATAARINAPAPSGAQHVTPASGWPERGECCWPVNGGRPWAFCGAPADPRSRAGYCAKHHGTERSKAPPAGTMIDTDLTKRVPTVVNGSAGGWR